MPRLKADLIVDDHGSLVVKRFADNTSRYMHSAAGSVKGMISSFSSLQGLLAGAGMGLGAKHMIDTAASFEQMEIKLNAITKGKGPETLERLNEWALEMPVNTRKAADTFAMMAAMGLDPTIEKMQTLVDVSVLFGEDAMPRVARALGQMRTLGKLSAEDLNQLIDVGIDARKYLTEAFGMTVDELQKSGKDINEIIKAITDGLDRDFGGAALRAMDSWQGLTATFISYVEDTERRLMDAGIFDALKEGLGGVNEELKEWLDTNDELIKQKVPEYIESIEDKVSGLWDFFDGLPDGTSKALLVSMLTGKVAGPVAGLSVGLGTFIAGVHDQHGFGTQWNTVDAPFDPSQYPADNENGRIMGADLMAAHGQQPGLVRSSDWVQKKPPSAQPEDSTGAASSGPADSGIMGPELPPGFDDIRAVAEWQDAIAAEQRSMLESMHGPGRDEFMSQQEVMQEKLAQLEEYLASETDLLDIATEERLNLVQRLEDHRIISAEQAAVMIEQIEDDHQKKLAAIEKKGLTQRERFERLSLQEKSKFALGEMARMTAGAAASNKTMFQINKAARMAEAGVELVSGTIKTWNAYPYPWNIPMTALHVATGVAQLSSLASSSFTGGAPEVATTGVAAVPSRETILNTAISDNNQGQSAAGEEASPNRTINITIYGDALDADGLARKLRDSLAKAEADGF